MRLSRHGFKILKSLEGYKNKLYNDSADHCTIGYGHLVHRGKVGSKLHPERFFLPSITKSIANSLLRIDVMEAEFYVNAYTPMQLNQNQFDALVCFVFNIGITAYSDSTLVKIMDKEVSVTNEDVFKQLRRWKYAGGKIIQGLINRREKEILLWKGEV